MLTRLLFSVARLISDLNQSVTPLNFDELELFAYGTFQDETQRVPVRKLYRELVAAGFTVWPINAKSTEHRLGLMWGVNSHCSRITEDDQSTQKPATEVKLLMLSADEDNLPIEVATILKIMNRVAGRFGLKTMLVGPKWVAGGALAFFCGFETELLQILTRKIVDGVSDVEQVNVYLEADAECREANSKGIVFASAPNASISSRH